MGEKMKVKVVPYDKVITIKMSGAFIGRLQEMGLQAMSTHEPEKIEEALKKIRDEAVDDNVSFTLETMIMLLNEIDRACTEQGVIVTEEIDIATGEKSS